jgi:hypothetical protein
MNISEHIGAPYRKISLHIATYRFKSQHITTHRSFKLKSQRAGTYATAIFSQSMRALRNRKISPQYNSSAWATSFLRMAMLENLELISSTVLSGMVVMQHCALVSCLGNVCWGLKAVTFPAKVNSLLIIVGQQVILWINSGFVKRDPLQ